MLIRSASSKRKNREVFGSRSSSLYLGSHLKRQTDRHTLRQTQTLRQTDRHGKERKNKERGREEGEKGEEDRAENKEREGTKCDRADGKPQR